jgi:periplasmic mercuric ion binding protein
VGQIKYFWYLKSIKMKRIQLSLVAIVSFCFSAMAQQKVAGKAVIKTPGITCEICRDRVERSLFKMYGVTSVKADFKKHTTTVTWITDRTNIEEIKTAIANAGYDADDVTAEEDAYKRLPAGCKKPAVVTVPIQENPIKPNPVMDKPIPPAPPVMAKPTKGKVEVSKKDSVSTKKKRIK